MNQGEKKAFWGIGIAFAAIIALTVYLENQHQEGQNSQPGPVTENQATASMPSEQAAVIPAGLNPADLPDPETRGATLLTLYCAQCHELPSPSMHTQAEWDDVLERMKNHMQATRDGMLNRVLIPPEKDWAILQTYMNTHGQTPLSTATSHTDSAASSDFVATCSQCHAAPNPDSHTRNEWPRVVLRMKSHIIRTGKIMPDQDTLMSIIDYLQQNAKDA